MVNTVKKPAYEYDKRRASGAVTSDIGTAITSHENAGNPHPVYLTQVEGDGFYAPIAKGVTNGDTHNHLGGDGGQIAYSSLSGLPTLVTDHGALTGLGDDDHTQYAKLAGDTFTGDVKLSASNLILPKTSGKGIKVDTASPTYPWADLIGALTTRGTGATDPTLATYVGNIKEYQFAVDDEQWVAFSLPHDYAPGTDIYFGVFWSHISTLVTGGDVTWHVEALYSKGHNQAAFPGASLDNTFTSNASTTQRQLITAELQLSAASPSATQIDQALLEPAGVLLARFHLHTNSITVSSGSAPKPFVHSFNLHYQSTGIGTKNKTPNFYS